MERIDIATLEPCLNCGACCATYRVSFYWAEADALAIPDQMVEAITPLYACLAGTNQARPRCQALTGEVGQAVKCSMYLQRPSPCHELQAGDEKCNRARAKHGLPALQANTLPAAGI